MIEVELKAWIDDYAKMRAAVEEAGAVFEKESTKNDHYYGPAKKTARDIDFDKDPMFRLRNEGGKGVVGTKTRDLAEDVEINDEVEFEVSDVASFRLFAKAIGFHPVIVKRKQTRTYKLGRATVELNRIDPLGDFIEIEVLVDDRSEAKEAEDEVRSLLERFGVPKAKVEPRRYIDLLRKIGRGIPGRGE